MVLQKNRPYEVAVPHLGAEKFALMSIEGSEYVSHPFNFRILAVTDDADINEEDLLRKPIVATLRSTEDKNQQRYVHGLIQRSRLLRRTDVGENLYHWEMTVVPSLWFLSLDQDCRHFENMNVKQIVEKVFQAAGFTDFTFKLQGTLREREFTVQYRESSLNFISRLLEEEGIFYYFEHSQQKHQLILLDKNATSPTLPGKHSLDYGKGTVSGAGMGLVDDLEQTVQVHTGKVTLTDYNFTMANVKLEVSNKGKQINEEYDFPGLYTTKSEGEAYVKLRLEEQEARLRTVHFHTICQHLIPGYKFELKEHFRSTCNTTYLILSQSFSMRQNAIGEDPEAESAASTQVSALPVSVPYRPPRRHKKPMIHGVQTAMVTGPAGNEIYCDKYGRVKVRFHWDRTSQPPDKRTSCWIRVAQGWAGPQWGQIHIPRIDNEVIVSFLEGDPDRPIITGMVYNSSSMPPYALPGNQTQSGIKTHSSPHGSSDDFNEFRFEDKKGSEEIYLHAQKDFNEYIENKHTQTVRDSDQIITLKQGNHSMTVETGNHTTKIDKGNMSTTVSMGNQSTECTAGALTEKAAQKIQMTVTPSDIKMTPAGIELTIGASAIKMTAASIEISCGAAKIQLVPAMIMEQAPMIKLN